MNLTFEAAEIAVQYGTVKALAGVSVSVGSGELVGLIGPNGAGKTTFIDAVTGFVPAGGDVRLDGTDLTTTVPHVRARAGLGRTWQASELFHDLSVRENMEVAGDRLRGWRLGLEVLRGRTQAASVDEVAALVGLDMLLDRMPDELTQGQRKLVGIGRALAGRPKIVCLDEPAAGLDSAESQELGASLRAVVTAGTGILLVDHDMGLVLSVCDRVVVLDFGEVIATGTPREIRTNGQVIAAYLGKGSDDPGADTGSAPSRGAINA